MSGINPYVFQTGTFSLSSGTTYPVQQGQILSLPSTLSSLPQTIQIKGEVTSQNTDGTTIIKTPQGDMSVKLTNPLPVGTKLDMQILSGNSSREAYIQPSLAKTINAAKQDGNTAQNTQAKPSQQNPAPSSATVTSDDAAAVIKPSATQLLNTDVKVLQTTTLEANRSLIQNGGTQSNTTTLQEGQPVRITPLPAALQTMTALATQFPKAETVPTQTFLTQILFQNKAAPTPLAPPLASTGTLLPSPQAVIPQGIAPQAQTQQATTQTPASAPQMQSAEPPRPQQAGTGTTPQPNTAQTQSTPQTPLTINTVQIHQPSLPLVTSLRQILLPPTMSLNVSGNRTPRPMPIQLSLPQQTTPEAPITATNTQRTLDGAESLRPQQTTDSRVLKIIEPMHIRPPVAMNSSVGMASAILRTAQTDTSFSQLTLMNSFAGESIAIATGFTMEDGSPIVQILLPASQTQMASVNYPARSLPEGAQITLSPLPPQQNAIPVKVPSTAQDQEVLQQLLQALPKQQVQMLMDLMPSTTNARQFPAAALLFLAAAKNGDLSAWLGTKTTRNIDALPQSSSKNTLQKILGDLLNQSGGNTKTPSPNDPATVQTGDWRGHQLPLLSGTDLHTATLWVKDDKQQSTPSDDRKKTGTRFLVDLHLTRMGAVQFDGLVHPVRKTLDLSFVTQRTISRPMQDKLKTIWYNTLENLGYSGSINFKEHR